MHPPQNPSLDLTNSGNPDNANPSSPAQPPVLQINGENPAHIHVGDSYTDLGASITAPDADKNLGLKYFLNGALVGAIVFDTSAAATDTIDYVATDPTGLSATSTRTVIVSGAANDNSASSTPSAASDNSATTTVPAATSSAQ
jgi:hypothetical protein